jgi:hypothetical protein
MKEGGREERKKGRRRKEDEGRKMKAGVKEGGEGSERLILVRCCLKEIGRRDMVKRR